MTGRSTHGHTRGRKFSPEYMSWVAMKARCLNVNSEKYPRYGGRGIKVCDRWRDSYEAFFDDMGTKPDPGHTIERLDNDGHYEPSNCCWAPLEEQANNRSNNRLIAYGGKSLSVAQWAVELGMDYGRLQSRIARGWPIERALDPTARTCRLARQAPPSEPIKDRQCALCGVAFLPRSAASHRIYCTNACRKISARRAWFAVPENRERNNARRRAQRKEAAK